MVMEPVPENDPTPEVMISGEEAHLSKSNDRLTMRLDVYQESYGEEPVRAPVAVSTALQTHGIEPYIRRFVATPEEKELTFGDIRPEDVGYIMLVNVEGTVMMETPTEEEREAIDSKIALVNDVFAIGPYGMPFLAQIVGPITIRSAGPHNVKLKTYIFPR